MFSGPRFRSGTRRSTSVLAFALAVVWLSGSNHCVLESFLAPGAAGSGAHCPLHEAKSGPAANGGAGMLACCKGLLSSAFEVAKVHVDFDPGPVISNLYAYFLTTLYIDPPEMLVDAATTGTAPPKWISFLESVLHLSMRANAPPSHI